MKIEAQILQHILFLILEGDLIGQESGMKMLSMVNKELIGQTIEHCALDMSNIRYMDSSGIGVLLTIHNEIKNKTKGGVVLINPSEQVIKLLNITKLNTVLSIVKSHEAAIEKLKA